jgi:hypothetical protein
MALAISIVSEEKNIYVIPFDGKPQINDIVDAIKEKISQEGIMSITDWYWGFNYNITPEFAKELTKAINEID